MHGGEASGIKEIAHSAVGVLQQNGPGWCWGGTACCRACARYTSVCTAHAYGMIVRGIGGAWVGRHVGLDGTLGGRMPSLHHRFQSFMLADPRDCATARAPAGTRAVGSGGGRLAVDACWGDLAASAPAPLATSMIGDDLLNTNYCTAHQPSPSHLHSAPRQLCCVGQQRDVKPEAG